MIGWFKKIWFILTLDCEQSAYLTSQSFDRDLSFSERWAVRLHCLICSKSRKLKKQMTALNERLRASGDLDSLKQKFQLSEEAFERISKNLKNSS